MDRRRREAWGGSGVREVKIVSAGNPSDGLFESCHRAGILRQFRDGSIRIHYLLEFGGQISARM